MRISDWSSDVCSSDLDARCAPHIVDGIGIAGIVLGGALRDDVPHVLEVRQLRLVELLEHAGLDLAREEAAGRHHDVVAGAARQQLGLEDLVGIEDVVDDADAGFRSEEHTSELQSLMRISYAVFCLKKKNTKHIIN